jgi:hypothetical protein
LALLIALVGSVMTCEHPISIPAGAQVVHLTVDGAGIHLAPETAHAGDVYLVIDTFGAAPVLIQQMETETNQPGGLSDERLQAVLAGDSFHTSISSGFADGGEPYGNVNLLQLTQGVHLFATHEPSGRPFQPNEFARLMVTP